jgi:hypothetical protein
MEAPTTTLDPVKEAEATLQVVGVLSRLEQRFSAGAWARGARFGDGGTCLIGGVDEATRWVMPGVARQVEVELAARLPQPFRLIGGIRPRLGLAMYNDLVGGREGALKLVRRTYHELGGQRHVIDLTTDVPAPAPSRAWTAQQR